MAEHTTTGWTYNECQAGDCPLKWGNSRFSVDEALREIEDAIRHINRNVEQNTPWRSFKDGDHEAVHRVLYTASEALRLVSVLIHPVMPDKTEELWRRLAWVPDAELSNGLAWGGLRPGSTVTLGPPLFPKDTRGPASI